MLTSLADADLRETGVAGDGDAPGAAPRAADRGVRPRRRRLLGASKRPALRAALGPRFKLVTPGIRPAGSGRDDQARIVTPEAAIANGADYLVIGRPITRRADPVAALAAINASLGVAA